MKRISKAKMDTLNTFCLLATFHAKEAEEQQAKGDLSCADTGMLYSFRHCAADYSKGYAEGLCEAIAAL